MQSFSVFLLGAEVPGWRKLLGESGARNVGVSFKGLRPRLPKTRSFDMSRWPAFGQVMLDSGGFGINKKADMSTEELEVYGQAYAEFALEHAEHFSLISEFDSYALGPDYIEEQRAAVWSQLERPDQFLPIWHPQSGGIEELERLAERYPRVGVPPEGLSEPAVVSRLLQIARGGVRLHGLAMTKPDVIKQGFFDSVSSTSWLSPLKFGDTIVWDGMRLARYPKRMKDQARRRHRTLFEREGFDPDAIESDDPHEMARLTIWSWQQFEQNIGAQRVGARLSGSYSPDGADGASGAVVGPQEVATSMREIAPPPRALARTKGERKTLPVFGFRSEDQLDETGAVVGQQSLPVINHRALRVCDSCFIAARCPEFRPGSECAFDLPLEVKTPQQRQALLNGLVELQGKRVAFMRFAEELSGGYADPNLSQEIDRLMKVFSTIAELEDTRDFFRMTVEGRGNTGVISRLFGGEAGERVNQIAQPLDAGHTDSVIQRVLEIEPA